MYCNVEILTCEILEYVASLFLDISCWLWFHWLLRSEEMLLPMLLCLDLFLRNLLPLIKLLHDFCLLKRVQYSVSNLSYCLCHAKRHIDIKWLLALKLNVLLSVRGELPHIELQEPWFEQGLISLRSVVIVVHSQIKDRVHVFEHLISNLAGVSYLPDP